MAVPEKDGNLVVPNNVATEKLGKVIKRIGVCTNPPPPIIASIKPATNAARQTIRVSEILSH
jgi:hypothetical protein